MKSYQKQWIAKRRMAWIEKNGPCKHCGSNEKLEIDHINPSTKMKNPQGLWSRRIEVREAELKKCQVLCYNCHKKKTAIDLRLRFVGRPNLKLRRISDEKFNEAKRLIESGLSERKACTHVGLCRGTYSSLKIRGYR